MKRALFFGLFLLMQCGLASAATFYVDDGGSNTDCTTIQTIGTPAQTLTFALACMSAGDTMYVRAGTYGEGNATYGVFDQGGGVTIPAGTAWDNAINISTYNSEAVTTTYQFNIQDNGDLSVPAYIIVTGFTMPNFRVAGNVHHIRMQQNHMTGNKNATDCDATVKIVSTTDNVQVLQNNIEGAIVCFFTGFGQTIGEYGIYGNGTNMLIDRNVIHDNAGYAIHLYLQGQSVNDQIVTNNVMYGNGCCDGDRNTTNSAIILAGNNNIMYNNVIYSNPLNGNGPAIQLQGDGNKAYNNTVYDHVGPGLDVLAGGTGNIVQNNIFWSNGSGIDDNGTSTTATNNLTTDPSFVNAGAANFHLQSGSAARNAGTTIAAVTADIDGNPRPQEGTYDIGAYEFVATTVPLVFRLVQ